MSDGPGRPPDGGQHLPEVPRQIIDRGAAGLEGLVPVNAQAEVVQRVLTAVQAGVSVQRTEITTSQHISPIPSPATIAQYEQILPGSAERFFAMAERDQAATIKSNTRQQWLEFAFNSLALLMGGGGLIAILLGVIYLAEKGHSTEAVALIGLGVSGIVGAFVNARLKQSANSDNQT